LDFSIAHREYDKDVKKAKRVINTKWLKTTRPNLSRWPKSFARSDFVEEVSDLITLLSNVRGLSSSSTFHEWMYPYIKIMLKGKKYIFWGE